MGLGASTLQATDKCSLCRETSLLCHEQWVHCWMCNRTWANQSVTQAGMFPGLGVQSSHQHLLRDLFQALLFIAALHGITTP